MIVSRPQAPTVAVCLAFLRLAAALTCTPPGKAAALQNHRARSRHLMTTILIALALSASFHSAAAQSPSPLQAVLQAERRGCLAYQTRDVQGVRDFLTDDYTLTDAKGVLTTKQDDLDDFLKDRIRYTTFQNANMIVRLYAKTAIVTGQTHVIGVANGSTFDVTVQFTDTLVFLQGRWRLAAGHVSRLPPTQKTVTTP